MAKAKKSPKDIKTRYKVVDGELLTSDGDFVDEYTLVEDDDGDEYIAEQRHSFDELKRTTSNKLRYRPVMFRARPGLFIFLCLLTIATAGLGIVFLFIWFLRTRRWSLTLDKNRATVRCGLKRDFLIYSDIAKVTVRQSSGQKRRDVGRLILVDAADTSVGITIPNLRHPRQIKKEIDLRIAVAAASL